MILYDYWRSSSAWRVRIALSWKGITHERRAVSLIRNGGEQHDPSFVARNPLSQVPVLELDAEESPTGATARITQSMAIIEYLEERFPSPALLPSEPLQRARARQLAEMVNAGIQPLQNLHVVNHVKEELRGDGAAWIGHFMTRGLVALEKTAVETAGAFLVGDAVSIADVYLVPQLYTARRFGVPLETYPTLLRVETACVALPAFQVAHADKQSDAIP